MTSMQAKLEIIDTIPAYLAYWDQVKDLPIDEQIESWNNVYLKPWPGLVELQIEDYTSQGLSWKKIAREKVFPYLSGRFSAIHVAHQNLIKVCEPVFRKSQQLFTLECEVIIVIYVGIGCGAGWVTSYQDSPAILFGLENVAKCGWSNRDAISGLVAHEFGHLIHEQLRRRNQKTNGSGPWWQLYSEGFAQYCERMILRSDSWHQAMGEDEGWLRWCQANKGWLASEFLNTVDTGQPTTPFFGSWFDIKGKSQTGYFLGNEVISKLVKGVRLEDIALIGDVENTLRPILEEICAEVL
ncbi:hypothetical protein ACFLXI_08420 [Chloroflexota bacterium]